MKGAVVLLLLGTALAVDGTIRFVMGMVNYAPLLAVGGVLTGWLLGGFLLIKGYRRFKHNDVS